MLGAFREYLADKALVRERYAPVIGHWGHWAVPSISSVSSMTDFRGIWPPEDACPLPSPDYPLIVSNAG